LILVIPDICEGKEPISSAFSSFSREISAGAALKHSRTLKDRRANTFISSGSSSRLDEDSASGLSFLEGLRITTWSKDSVEVTALEALVLSRLSGSLSVTLPTENSVSLSCSADRRLSLEVPIKSSEFIESVDFLPSTLFS